MKPEDRLIKIRSILREAEREMDSPSCDQISLLRKVFLDISIAVGPQASGKPRLRKKEGTEVLP